LSCFETGLGVTVLSIGAVLSNPVSCWPNDTTLFPYTKNFPGSPIAEERKKFKKNQFKRLDCFITQATNVK